MTIKKTKPEAAIADRFKLDTSEAKKGPQSSKKATTFALAAGCLALAVVGILAFTLYQHLEFLKGV